MASKTSKRIISDENKELFYFVLHVLLASRYSFYTRNNKYHFPRKYVLPLYPAYTILSPFMRNLKLYELSKNLAKTTCLLEITNKTAT